MNAPLAPGAAAAPDHAALMDRVYRSQRHIYDVSRKYFLFGRDTLIAGLNCGEGDSVLEVGCGTGRNLACIARAWPGTRLHGLDISAEMLRNAQARLHGRAKLAKGDATAFDAAALFGRAQFDRVVLSFTASMIPDWQAALTQALDVLAPGGSLHLVDFGASAGLPTPLRALLRDWLAHFHVTPRLDLAAVATRLATERGMNCHIRQGRFCYFTLVTVQAPAP
jgi:S-adenosylmethionine-diacylgycerolhomoserine-N-methlytransferase